MNRDMITNAWLEMGKTNPRFFHTSSKHDPTKKTHPRQPHKAKTYTAQSINYQDLLCILTPKHLTPNHTTTISDINMMSLKKLKVGLPPCGGTGAEAARAW